MKKPTLLERIQIWAPMGLAFVLAILAGSLAYRACVHLPINRPPPSPDAGGLFVGMLTLVFSMILTGFLRPPIQIATLAGLALLFILLHAVIFGS